MPPSDEVLMARCRDGDAEAFETLMRKHLHGVTIHLQRIVLDSDEAQDLAQEAFLRLYTSRASYTGEGKFTTWLYRIATNAAIDHLRRRGRRQYVSLFATLPPEEEGAEEAELHETLADPGAQAPSEILAAREDWAAFGSALAQLSAPHREIFELRVLEGLDYKTIADRLGVTPEAARSRLHAAKQELRRSLHLRP